MDPTSFATTPFGQPALEPGNRWAFWYYKPSPIPRALPIDGRTVKSLSDADASLGRLQGLGALIRNPELLLGPYLTREAVASSRIEGTQASLSDVLQAEASETPTPSEDVAEVERYVAATRQGYSLVRGLPISQRLVLELHKTLLTGVRGQEKLPGQFRTSPVWVGSPTDTPDTATYVPPLPGEIPELIADWERFINEPTDLPTLIRCGLVHYQFETIHPFLDGNGRIGRLLINLMLLEEGRLDTPLLYLSGYLEENRWEYYERLQAVRERGEIQQWLQFFLTAVQHSADDAVSRATRMVAIRETYMQEAAATRSSLPALVELIFSNPFITVKRLQMKAQLTPQGARNVLKDATNRGWLSEVGTRGRGGRMWWVAHEVLEIIDSPRSFHHNGR